MITFLSGGTGTPKLIQGFRDVLKDNEISVIANSADDIWIYGLYVSPDIDTILYLFSNHLDTEKYWGVKDETYETLKFLSKLGINTWFKLGDKDLAIHLLRSDEISRGETMSSIVNKLKQKLKIQATIFPSSENHIETRIITKDNRDLHFQEFWVREKGIVDIKKIYVKNIEKANAPDKAIQALDKSKLIVIGPSNPITSIGPIIQIREFRESLKRNRDKCIAISPIIGEAPVSGPTGELMKVEGMEVSSQAVAESYKDLCSTFVIHNLDSKMKKNIENEVSIEVVTENILFKDVTSAKELASKILKWR